MPAGQPLAELQIVDSEGRQEPQTLTMLGGLLQRVALKPTAMHRLVVKPQPGWDFGSGPGRPLQALLQGGAVGLILDGRGRTLPWPAAELARRDMVRGWLQALSALPEGVVL